MNTKTKAFQTGLLIASILVFIGYFLSLYKGNDNNISNYNLLILIFACFNTTLYSKEKLQYKALNILAKLNCVMLVIWAITIVVQIFAH